MVDQVNWRTWPTRWGLCWRRTRPTRTRWPTRNRGPNPNATAPSSASTSRRCVTWLANRLSSSSSSSVGPTFLDPGTCQSLGSRSLFFSYSISFVDVEDRSSSSWTWRWWPRATPTATRRCAPSSASTTATTCSAPSSAADCSTSFRLRSFFFGGGDIHRQASRIRYRPRRHRLSTPWRISFASVSRWWNRTATPSTAKWWPNRRGFTRKGGLHSRIFLDDGNRTWLWPGFFFISLPAGTRFSRRSGTRKTCPRRCWRRVGCAKRTRPSSKKNFGCVQSTWWSWLVDRFDPISFYWHRLQFPGSYFGPFDFIIRNFESCLRGWSWHSPRRTERVSDW